jgi:lipid-A-disaccharide synthase
VRKLPRIIDKLLCILPFEERLHREAGTDATYVGNPSAHALGKRVRERNFSPEAPRILLMPGSRNREIDTMLPKLLGAAEMLRSQHDGISYGLVRASSITEERLQAHLSRHPDLNVELLPPEASHDAMLSSDLGWLTSGTVTLEAACAGLPLLLGYREKRLFWAVYKRLRHTELIGLPNLLLGREEFPELTQELSEPWHWCRLSLEWLGDSGKLAHKRDILRRELLEILEPERDPFAEAAAVISRLRPA